MTSAPVTSILSTTTTAPGRTVSFTFTTSPGWKYSVRIAIPTKFTFGKDISTSAPGKARLTLLMEGAPTGQVSNATPGRQPPTGTAAFYFHFSVPGGFDPNASDPNASFRTGSATRTNLRCTSSQVLTFFCDGGQFGVGGGIVSPPRIDGDIGEFSEATISRVLTALTGQQPLIEILLIPADGCSVYLYPDGSLKPGQRGCDVQF